MKVQNFGRFLVMALAVAGAPVSAVDAGTVNSQIGYDDLVSRLGAGNVPTGAGVIVGQVEALESAGNYGPNQSNSEFNGKIFNAVSGPPGASNHATSVAASMYGGTLSIANGITTIYLYEAGSWAQSAFLRTNQGSGSPPLPSPNNLKIFNNSWIGSFGTPTLDNDALRRADYVVTRDSLIIVNGVNNGGASQPLLSHMFNGIAVGVTGGTHTFGGTLASYDGPGRMKPEIVAPSAFTSFAAPIVDAVAALLVQTARTAPGLSNNPNALRGEVLKAVILAGGNHRLGWSNNPSTSGANRGVTSMPLDPVYGVDVVNVNRSHLILTGLETDGSDSSSSAPAITNRGWDLATINSGASKYYKYHVSAVADKSSIIASWHRKVQPNFLSYTVADINLTLWRVDGASKLTTLVGNPGLAFFSGGNVVSQSTIDNLEHLYINNLQPGDYVLQVARADANGGMQDVGVAWLFPTPPLIGDVNHDNHVNVDDLLAVINAWGACPQPCPPSCPADITGNCMVDVDDLLAVITHWTT